MSTPAVEPGCSQRDLASAYAIGSLPAEQKPDFIAHLESCVECRSEVESLRPVVSAFAHWPADELRPSPSLWNRLTRRIAPDGFESAPAGKWPWSDPEWEDVAPGIACKLLATDLAKDRVTMLVRLAPGTAYPPHTHAGVEELHLLDGELWIEDRKMFPGDYNRADAGTSDRRVFSETGCTCILITSPSDVLHGRGDRI